MSYDVYKLGRCYILIPYSASLTHACPPKAVYIQKNVTLEIRKVGECNKLLLVSVGFLELTLCLLSHFLETCLLIKK